jgi:hypothetical protein
MDENMERKTGSAIGEIGSYVDEGNNAHVTKVVYFEKYGKDTSCGSIDVALSGEAKAPTEATLRDIAKEVITEEMEKELAKIRSPVLPMWSASTGEEVFLRSQMRENRKSGSVRGLTVVSERRWL